MFSLLRQDAGGTPALPDFAHTITTVAESPLKAGLLWVGTDDGRVHLTRNGGRDWTDLSDNSAAVIAGAIAPLLSAPMLAWAASASRRPERRT